MNVAVAPRGHGSPPLHTAARAGRKARTQFSPRRDAWSHAQRQHRGMPPNLRFHKQHETRAEHALRLRMARASVNGNSVPAAPRLAERPANLPPPQPLTVPRRQLLREVNGEHDTTSAVPHAPSTNHPKVWSSRTAVYVERHGIDGAAGDTRPTEEEAEASQRQAQALRAASSDLAAELSEDRRGKRRGVRPGTASAVATQPRRPSGKRPVTAVESTRRRHLVSSPLSDTPTLLDHLRAKDKSTGIQPPPRVIQAFVGSDSVASITSNERVDAASFGAASQSSLDARAIPRPQGGTRSSRAADLTRGNDGHLREHSQVGDAWALTDVEATPRQRSKVEEARMLAERFRRLTQSGAQAEADDADVDQAEGGGSAAAKASAFMAVQRVHSPGTPGISGAPAASVVTHGAAQTPELGGVDLRPVPLLNRSHLASGAVHASTLAARETAAREAAEQARIRRQAALQRHKERLMLDGGSGGSPRSPGVRGNRSSDQAAAIPLSPFVAQAAGLQTFGFGVDVESNAASPTKRRVASPLRVTAPTLQSSKRAATRSLDATLRATNGTAPSKSPTKGHAAARKASVAAAARKTSVAGVDAVGAGVGGLNTQMLQGLLNGHLEEAASMGHAKLDSKLERLRESEDSRHKLRRRIERRRRKADRAMKKRLRKQGIRFVEPQKKLRRLLKSGFFSKDAVQHRAAEVAIRDAVRARRARQVVERNAERKHKEMLARVGLLENGLPDNSAAERLRMLHDRQKAWLVACVVGAAQHRWLVLAAKEKSKRVLLAWAKAAARIAIAWRRARMRKQLAATRAALAAAAKKRRLQREAEAERKRLHDKHASADLIIGFLETVRRSFRIRQVFARFRFNVRRAQRILRQLFACSHARLEVLGRVFDDVAATEYEHRVAHMLAHLHTSEEHARTRDANLVRRLSAVSQTAVDAARHAMTSKGQRMADHRTQLARIGRVLARHKAKVRALRQVARAQESLQTEEQSRDIMEVNVVTVATTAATGPATIAAQLRQRSRSRAATAPEHQRVANMLLRARSKVAKQLEKHREHVAREQAEKLGTAAPINHVQPVRYTRESPRAKKRSSNTKRRKGRRKRRAKSASRRPRRKRGAKHGSRRRSPTSNTQSGGVNNGNGQGGEDDRSQQSPPPRSHSPIRQQRRGSIRDSKTAQRDKGLLGAAAQLALPVKAPRRPKPAPHSTMLSNHAATTRGGGGGGDGTFGFGNTTDALARTRRRAPITTVVEFGRGEYLEHPPPSLDYVRVTLRRQDGEPPVHVRGVHAIADASLITDVRPRRAQQAPWAGHIQLPPQPSLESAAQRAAAEAKRQAELQPKPPGDDASPLAIWMHGIAADTAAAPRRGRRWSIVSNTLSVANPRAPRRNSRATRPSPREPTPAQPQASPRLTVQRPISRASQATDNASQPSWLAASRASTPVIPTPQASPRGPVPMFSVSNAQPFDFAPAPNGGPRNRRASVGRRDSSASVAPHRELLRRKQHNSTTLPNTLPLVEYLGGTVRAVKIAMVANALPRKPVQIPLHIKWRVLIAYLSLLRRRYQDHVEQKFSSLKELKELVVVKVDKDMVRDMMSRTHGRMHELLEERFAAVRGAQTPTKREWPLFGMLTQFMLPGEMKQVVAVAHRMADFEVSARRSGVSSIEIQAHLKWLNPSTFLTVDPVAGVRNAMAAAASRMGRGGKLEALALRTRGKALSRMQSKLRNAGIKALKQHIVEHSAEAAGGKHAAATSTADAAQADPPVQQAPTAVADASAATAAPTVLARSGTQDGLAQSRSQRSIRSSTASPRRRHASPGRAAPSPARSPRRPPAAASKGARRGSVIGKLAPSLLSQIDAGSEGLRPALRSPHGSGLASPRLDSRTVRVVAPSDASGGAVAPAPRSPIQTPKDAAHNDSSATTRPVDSSEQGAGQLETPLQGGVAAEPRATEQGLRPSEDAATLHDSDPPNSNTPAMNTDQASPIVPLTSTPRLADPNEGDAARASAGEEVATTV